MNDSRAAILGRVRLACADGAAAKVESRLAEHPRGPQPSWSDSAPERFLAKLEQAAGSHVQIESVHALPAAVQEYLDGKGLAARLVAAPHPLLSDLEWAAPLEMETRVAGARDEVALSVAICGVAETGSLVMASGQQSPTTLNFLPDHFLCVLDSARIVQRLEDAWDLLRAESGAMPRALNLITGPSRTADVEQTIQLGAHGPRRLHVIMLRKGR